MDWVLRNPSELLERHVRGQTYLAIHPQCGVVVAAEDADEFEAQLNDRRPSVLRELFLTSTHLWVRGAAS